MASSKPAVTFRDVTLGYDRHPAVHHITGEVEAGALLALVGPNGAGKSTLLKGIVGELRPLSGSLKLDSLRKSGIAYLPQQIEIDRLFPITVFDCAAMGLWRKIGAWRGLDRRHRQEVARALATVGLQDLADRLVGALSGGQFQRVLFARLLLQDAALILLDEPFRAVDTKTVADLIALIGRWHSEGRTVLAALHDIELVRAHFPATLVLAREVVAWGETRKVLTPANLAKSRQLVEAFDEQAGICARDESSARAAAGMIDAIVTPFVEFSFMRRALVGCLALSLGAPPIGVFLMLRRMSLMGDAMSHAVLPGAAIGYLLFGLSLPAMSLGGFAAGLAVALAAGLVARSTMLREDASLAGFYLVSLALGVLIVSVKGSNIDLLHVLFGTVLALDDAALILVAAIATVSLIVLAVIYRPLVLECFDPQFLRSASRWSSPTHLIFLMLVVLNLVAGFQALGTLMAVGIMLLPAVTARFWAEDVSGLILVAIGCAAAASLSGLLLSYYANLPTGPAIILLCGVFYLLSMLLGVRGGFIWNLVPRRHLEA